LTTQEDEDENERISPGGVRSEYNFFYLPIDFRYLVMDLLLWQGYL